MIRNLLSRLKQFVTRLFCKNTDVSTADDTILYKGRLNGLRVYLAGPMDKCPNGGISWRANIKPLLRQLGVDVYCPVEKPISGEAKNLETMERRKQRQQDKKNGLYQKFCNEMKNIRHTDLRMVDVSDFIIAYLDFKINYLEIIIKMSDLLIKISLNFFKNLFCQKFYFYLQIV